MKKKAVEQQKRRQAPSVAQCEFYVKYELRRIPADNPVWKWVPSKSDNNPVSLCRVH